jgi:serine/threonine-protein kinase
MAKAAAHLHEPPPTLRSRRAALPLALEPVVARALAKRPEDRYQTAGELGAAALEAAQAPGATPRTRRLRRQARTSATARLTSRHGLRRPVALLAVAATVAGLAVAVALGAFSSDGKSPAPARPVSQPPPPANPSLVTVRCSTASCTQRGARVVPPIEGAGCTPAGRAGEWQRIDADGQSPLFGCVPADSPPAGATPLAVVPDLAGARLDHAEELLDRFGVSHDTSGGGTFGIIDRGNWTVCTTTPPAGAAVARDASVKLYVDRSC